MAEGFKLELPGAELLYYPELFSQQESREFFELLLQNVVWSQPKIRLFGKEHPIPRWQSWYGEPEARYTYSGITLTPLPWLKPMLDIKTRIEPLSQTTFNSVLVNLYRHEKDSNGWHADDERGLGPRPVIGSVSLGAPRKFQIRARHNKNEKVSLDLAPGSFLLMAGWTQRDFLHQVPKQARKVGPRINLTFRTIFPELLAERKEKSPTA